MYDDTGTKIKARASSYCFLKIFGNAILGGSSFFAFIHYASLTGKEWPQGLPDLIIPALLFLTFYFVAKIVRAWNEYLLIAGYGELIAETTKTASQLEEIKKILLKKDNQKTDTQLEEIKMILMQNKSQAEGDSAGDFKDC